MLVTDLVHVQHKLPAVAAGGQHVKRTVGDEGFVLPPDRDDGLNPIFPSRGHRRDSAALRAQPPARGVYRDTGEHGALFRYKGSGDVAEEATI